MRAIGCQEVLRHKCFEICSLVSPTLVICHPLLFRCWLTDAAAAGVIQLNSHCQALSPLLLVFLDPFSFEEASALLAGNFQRTTRYLPRIVPVAGSSRLTAILIRFRMQQLTGGPLLLFVDVAEEGKVCRGTGSGGYRMQRSLLL